MTREWPDERRDVPADLFFLAANMRHSCCECSATVEQVDLSVWSSSFPIGHPSRGEHTRDGGDEAVSARNEEALNAAQHLAESMKLLATEYQAIVRSTAETDEQGRKARRSLDRKFQKLSSREVIDSLREDGLTAVAETLDELFGACAMVFNLVAVSLGVDESEVLDIDVDGPYAAATDAVRREKARR